MTPHEYTVEQLDWILGRCVREKDFKGIRAGLTLMALQDPDRAEYWREMLLCAVEVGRTRLARETTSSDSPT